MNQTMLSVGIDIGTTTTQVIFSRMTIENTAGPFLLPEVKITAKQVVYRSMVHFTPLLAADRVDLAKLQEIIAGEYRRAGIGKEQIDTGAVIITGETARKENAEEVLTALADFAGDFVVATAGPDLEAVLAGLGAGAGEMSKEMAAKIINVDIGGGTSNAAVFWEGEVLDAFALDIGARVIRLDRQGQLTYISERIKPLLHSLGMDLKVGTVPELAQLEKLAAVFAGIFRAIQDNRRLTPASQTLFIDHTHQGIAAERIMFSGGVAEFIYGDQEIRTLSDMLVFGDMGPLLGTAIRNAFAGCPGKLLESREKIRATVIGAGSHSVTISGSTIAYDETVLPLKNIPIIKLCSGEEQVSTMAKVIARRSRVYGQEQVAIAFQGPISPSYQQIKDMARGIVDGLAYSRLPIVVIVENDFAKALGQTLRNLVNQEKPVICIDKIRVKAGEYVDVGKPIAQVVPVVIKTLIFT
ncbi:hypothetical protein P22_0646 [Propionispora sp. 2/2-37]|uniref:ethanolamine ammonia-lyase reactivating factor EutA n=1 Tax=Propionispora sp. 2/2-37 TaxID=1677858 RepID=UPI0006BB5D48|nr:ethanolamine ammonia-lyase reactivating factor EutA [Propionispora sp. 2/2-37]CUH94580.1 hypothetical protein P22_0646 [Propionispora sp. 2/2-37]